MKLNFIWTPQIKPLLCEICVFYGFSCHGCGANYIGKTGRTLYERTFEHTWADGNSTVQTSQGV